MTSPFWIILLAVLGYGLLHSILASLRMKSLVRKWVGPAADRWYRLVYNLVAIITLLPVLVLPVWLADKSLYRIHLPWVIFTLALQAIALVVLFFAIRQMGISSFLGLRQVYYPGEASATGLVTGGLYRYVRHPQYTAGLVLIWLFPIMTWNLLAINIGLTVYILFGAYVEERKTLLEFGDAYAKYRQHTPMLIPGFRMPKKDHFA